MAGIEATHVIVFLAFELSQVTPTVEDLKPSQLRVTFQLIPSAQGSSNFLSKLVPRAGGEQIHCSRRPGAEAEVS